MKNFTIALCIFLVLPMCKIQAQATDTDVVNFTAILASVLNLNVTAGQNQTATFDTPEKYNLGIDLVGTSTVTMEATSNWTLEINAADFTDGASAIIPINNLGVYCDATGAHTIGAEATCAYTSLATSLGLTNTDQMLIDNGTGNSGDASDNTFNLNWTMGTMNGTMNTASMFDQLSDGTIANLGTFTTTVNLTLTALP